jgi:hypothetical protein
VVGGEAECACDDFYDVVDHTQCILRECGSGVPGVDCRCLSVQPDGNDDDAAANDGRTPFRNIQPAIDYAFAHPNVAEHVCVAGGATCNEFFSYPSPPEGLVMRNGVSVHGSYESVGSTPCQISGGQTSGGTDIVLSSALGVYFGPDIDRPTKLERFGLARHTGATSAGVTVTGASGVSLAFLSITAGLESDVLYGVDVSGGARVALDDVRTFNTYEPGMPVPTVATGDVIGLHVVQSLVQAVRTHVSVYVEGGSATCAWFEDAPGSTFDAGSCTLTQMPPGASSLVGIRILGDADGIGIEGNTLTVGENGGFGEVASRRIIDIGGSGKVALVDNALVSRSSVGEVTGVHAVGASVEFSGSIRAESLNGSAHGIWLEDAPGSAVENAAITVSSQGGMPLMGVGVRVSGDAANTGVRSSTVDVVGGEQSAAIFLEECAGGSPIIADNPLVTVSSRWDAAIDAIRSFGACHPSIERNGVISAVSNGVAVVTAIRCGASEEGPSRCVIVDNPDIQAGMVNTRFASGSAFGVACEAGCCAEISRNKIIGLGRFELGCSRSCYPEAAGIYLIQANTLIDENTVSAGCADLASGIRVEGGTAQIFHNWVIARSNCGSEGLNAIRYSYGLYSTGGVIADSNSFDPGVTSPSSQPCISAGIRASGGTFTNNSLSAGQCETNAPFMSL